MVGLANDSFPPNSVLDAVIQRMRKAAPPGKWRALRIAAAQTRVRGRTMAALTNVDRTAQTARAVDALHAGDGRAQLSAGVAMTGLRAGLWHCAERSKNPRRQ